jgi:hypothetical protein
MSRRPTYQNIIIARNHNQNIRIRFSVQKSTYQNIGCINADFNEQGVIFQHNAIFQDTLYARTANRELEDLVESCLHIRKRVSERSCNESRMIRDAGRRWMCLS